MFWPFTRKKANQQIKASFDVSKTTADNRKHWANADGLSARAALSPGVRRVIRLRSRYEAENNSWYSGIIWTAVNHIIGNGPRLQVLTSNPEANQRLERAWRVWSSRINLAEKLRICFSTYWRDGEVFVMRADRPSAYPYTLDLRVYEADQVSNPWRSGVIDDQQVDDGIRFDAQTNELLFYIYNQHPGGLHHDVGGNWYPAKEVCHLFRVERPGQVRGIPRATSALQTLPIMRRQELATLYSAETAANFAMYLKSNSPSLDPANSPADFAEIELTRNMLTTLPAGWDIGQVEPKQPGPLYEMFQRQALMSFCRCTNMPYTLAAGTGKDANFSSFKGDMKNVWEPEVQTEQSRVENLLVEKFFQWFLESCVYVPGVLDGLPKFDDIEHRWQWAPLPELDARESADAAASRLKSGLSTLSDEHARRGHDWETESARAASDFGVTIEEYRRAVFSETFAGATAADAAASQNPSETTVTTATTAVADTAMNGAQVSSIVAIIMQVAAGQIPAESAKALIRSAFPKIPQVNVDQMLAAFANVTPVAQGGSGATPAAPAGEYTTLSQRAFTNNQKRIKSTLDSLISGEITRVLAEQTLASIGLSAERIQALVEDALSGGIEDSVIQDVAV